MTELLQMIEAYGASMAARDMTLAAQHLEASQQRLADKGDSHFGEFWSEYPGPLADAGPLAAESVRTMCELAWWRARQTLVKGDAHRKATPRFLGRNNAIQTRP